jgi:hypothetical protein
MVVSSAYLEGPGPNPVIFRDYADAQGGHMDNAGLKSYPDGARLAELVQKIRVIKLDLSRIIEQGRTSKVASRLIMASGLLDGAIEELSKAASEQQD